MQIRNRFYQGIFIALGLLFLVSFSLPAFNQNLSQRASSRLELIQWIIWVLFILDFAFGLISSKHKSQYLKRHWLDLIAVAFPYFRPLRLMRLISFGSLVIERISIAKSLAVTVRVVISGFFIAYLAGIQLTLTERNLPNSNIKTASDGLWWALTTITTVGYGDRYPISTTGRIIALILMMVGISIVGVITANVAAWFVKMNSEGIHDK